MQKTIKATTLKTFFQVLTSVLIIASLFFILKNSPIGKPTITGFAASDIFFSIQDESSAVGFIARESSDETDSGYKLESAIIIPSGEFTEENYNVIIPYIGIEVITAGPGQGPGGGGGSRRELTDKIKCILSWQCSDYGECQPNNKQYRVCVKVGCEGYSWIETPPKPSEVKECKYIPQKEAPKPSPPPPVEEGFVFIVKPKIDKKYKPGDQLVLYTYINNPGDKLNNLEIEYNIDEATKRTEYVEYEGVFDVNSKSKFEKDIDTTLVGYSNKKYRVHATLYKNGEKLAESYHDLDLT